MWLSITYPCRIRVINPDQRYIILIIDDHERYIEHGFRKERSFSTKIFSKLPTLPNNSRNVVI